MTYQLDRRLFRRKTLLTYLLFLAAGIILLGFHFMTRENHPALEALCTPIADLFQLRDSSTHYTRVKQVIDCVSSALSLVYSLLFLLYAWKINPPLQTPQEKPSFFILLNTVWLALIPAFYYYYVYRLDRSDYPVEADTILIPMMAVTKAILLLLPVINVLFFLFLFDAPLSVAIFSKFPHYSFLPVVLEILFGGILLALLSLLPGMVTDGDVTVIPILLGLLYLFASLRAAQTARWFRA